MIFHAQDGLRYCTFPLLEKAGLPHAMLTRRGGVSRAPFATLNMSTSVGDDADAVAENRRRAFALFRRPPLSAPEMMQVHSTRILLARRREAGEPLPEADGWVTDSPEFTLFMRFADCVPILLYDPVRNAAGIAHAGWKGTLAGMAARAVEAFQEHFHSNPEDLLAGIGPAIGPDHYPVGGEIAEAARAAFGPAAERWLHRQGGSIHLDLWSINEFLLRRSGVKSVERSGICTACHTEDWFSHRAENGRTGRFGAMVWLSK